jgi:hypothetical protein
MRRHLSEKTCQYNYKNKKYNNSRYDNRQNEKYDHMSSFGRLEGNFSGIHFFAVV